jgi:uncharacterized membrane protein
MNQVVLNDAAPVSLGTESVPLWIVLSLIAIVMWGAQSFLQKAASTWFEIPSSRSNLLITAVSTVMVGYFNADASISEFASFSTWGLVMVVITGVMSFSGTYAYLRAMEAPGAQASVVTSLCGLYPCVTLLLCVVFGFESITVKKLLGLFFALLSGLMFTSE